MKLFVTIFIMLLLTALELIIGNGGLALGLPFFGALYFGIAFGREYGITAAGSAGFILDLLYAREYLSGAFAGMLIVYLSCHAALRLQRSMPAAPLGSGMICGVLVNMCNLLTASLHGQPAPGPDFFSMLVFQFVGGGIFMLLTVLLFDAVNLRSNLPRFCLYDTNRHPGGRSYEISTLP